MEQPARLIQSSVPPVIIPLHRSSTSPSKDPRYKRPEYWLINLEYRRHGIKEISSKDWGVDLSQPASPSLDCSPVSMDSGICIDATAVSGETWIDKRSDPRLHRPRTPTQRSLINRTPGSKLKKKFEHKLFLNTTLPNLRQTNTTAAIKQSPEVVAIDEDKLVDAALPVDSNGRNDVYLEKVLNNVRRNQASKERSVLKIRSTPPAPLVKKRPQAMSSLPIYTVNRAPGSQLKKKPEKTLSLNNTLPNLVKKSSKSATIRRDTMKRRAPSPAMMNGPQPIKTVDLGRLKSTMEWVEKVTAQENCPLQRPDQRRFKQEVSQSDSQIPVRSSLHVSMSNSVHCPYQSNPTVQPYRGHPGPFQSVPQVYQYFPPVYSVLTPVPYSQHAPFRSEHTCNTS